MAEAFVDLLYRGLPLGSRARMSQFDAHHAYVELPAPMPVGTLIAIQAEGGPISAHVIEIHEQTAGSEHPPGMRVRPVLDGEAKLAWWAQASGDPSVASRAPDAAPSESKPESGSDAKRETTGDAQSATADGAKSEAKREPKSDARLEAADEAQPAAAADAAVEALVVESPIIAPRSQRADTDVEHVEDRPTEPMDIPSLPTAVLEAVAAADASVSSEAPDEPSGAVSADAAAESPEAPDPPAASGDSSPRGRNKRRNKRR